MDFNDTPEEAAFRKEVHAWLEANAEKKQHDEAAVFGPTAELKTSQKSIDASRTWQGKKFQGGWAGITWPKAYGGRGGTAMENIVFRQEESLFKVPEDVFGLGIGLAAPTIMVHGTEAQKQKFLKPTLQGELIWCQLFSEPSAGSDLAGLRTKAVKDGDEWIINGQKVWNSGAQYADWGILVTRSDFDAPKHKGLTYFLIDMKSPGIDVRPIQQITGGSSFSEVFFTDVRIPDENRLDKVGNGWAVSITTLMNERVMIGSGRGLSPKLMMSEISRLTSVAYIDGVLANENPAVRQRIAEYYARVKALELTGQRVLSAVAKGERPGPEGSVLKLATGILQQEIAAFAMELQGPLGIMRGTDTLACNGFWQELYIRIPATRIAGGSDEIQRNIIGERILGLPPEQRVDKGIPYKDIPMGR